MDPTPEMQTPEVGLAPTPTHTDFSWRDPPTAGPLLDGGRSGVGVHGVRSQCGLRGGQDLVQSLCTAKQGPFQPLGLWAASLSCPPQGQGRPTRAAEVTGGPSPPGQAPGLGTGPHSPEPRPCPACLSILGEAPGDPRQPLQGKADCPVEDSDTLLRAQGLPEVPFPLPFPFLLRTVQPHSSLTDRGCGRCPWKMLSIENGWTGTLQRQLTPPRLVRKPKNLHSGWEVPSGG